MVQSNSLLRLIDVWKLDLEEEVWEPFIIQSEHPLPRSEFASSKNGESIIIFGGQGDEGLLSDLHILNIQEKKWQTIEIRSTTRPSARKGACMTAVGRFILIFGGTTLVGYTNELWKFDLGTGEFEMVFVTGDIPPEISNCKCKADSYDDYNIKFQVYTGETLGDVPVPAVYEIESQIKVWKKIYFKGYELFGRSETASIFVNNYLLIAGGDEFGFLAHNEIFVLDVRTGEYVLLGYLPYNVYGSGMVYYGDRIYMHGGGVSQSELSISIPTNNLIIIELNQDCHEESQYCNWPCSKGTILVNSKCVSCPAGYYNHKVGAETCIPCQAGYYSKMIGADSSSFCTPCAEGTYNSMPGNSRCDSCLSNMSCPLAAIEQATAVLNDSEFVSSQPQLYEDNEEAIDSLINKIIIIASVLSSIIIILTLFLPRVRQLYQKFDIYLYEHNYDLGKVMYVKKTVFGGVFSILFLIVGFSISLVLIIRYEDDNIFEAKALIPLVALEQTYKTFKADIIKIEYTFKTYGGDCVLEDECVPLLTITKNDLNGKLQNPQCRKVGSDCKISLECIDCELVNSSSIDLVLSETQSFASEISVNMTSSSSIPDGFSSITTTLKTEPDTLMRGIDPSIISLLITPSLFISESNDWDTEITGYHISLYKESVVGSIVNLKE